MPPYLQPSNIAGQFAQLGQKAAAIPLGIAKGLEVGQQMQKARDAEEELKRKMKNKSEFYNDTILILDQNYSLPTGRSWAKYIRPDWDSDKILNASRNAIANKQLYDETVNTYKDKSGQLPFSILTPQSMPGVDYNWYKSNIDAAVSAHTKKAKGQAFTDVMRDVTSQISEGTIENPEGAMNYVVGKYEGRFDSKELQDIKKNVDGLFSKPEKGMPPGLAYRMGRDVKTDVRRTREREIDTAWKDWDSKIDIINQKNEELQDEWSRLNAGKTDFNEWQRVRKMGEIKEDQKHQKWLIKTMSGIEKSSTMTPQEVLQQRDKKYQNILGEVEGYFRKEAPKRREPETTGEQPGGIQGAAAAPVGQGAAPQPEAIQEPATPEDIKRARTILAKYKADPDNRMWKTDAGKKALEKSQRIVGEI